MPAPAIQTDLGFVRNEPTLCTLVRSATDIRQQIEEEVLSVYQQGLNTLDYHDLDLLLHIQGYEQQYEDQREAHGKGERRKPPKALSLAQFRRYYCPTSDLKRRLDPLEDMGLVELVPMPLPEGGEHGKKKSVFLTKEGWEVMQDIRLQMERLAKQITPSTHTDLCSAVDSLREMRDEMEVA